MPKNKGKVRDPLPTCYTFNTIPPTRILTTVLHSERSEIADGANRVVKIGVEERTRMIMRSVNLHSKKKAKVAHPHNAPLLVPKQSHGLISLAFTEYAQVLKMLGNGRLGRYIQAY